MDGGQVALAARDETATGRVLGSLSMRLDVACSARDLVRTRVRDEVSRYNAAGGGTYDGLIGAADDAARLNRSSRPFAPLCWEEHADRAVAAFAANGYFFLIDGRQVLDLDEELHLRPDTEITFVRLTALAGG